MTTRTLAVRARVVPRDGVPELLFDPLIDDLLRGGPISRERLATPWTDTAALRALADAKRRPLPADLAREMADYHRRLGASAASLANLERMARGEAVAAIAGQQPAPLGGPLYALHKTASTVGLARDVTARTGAACVPLFWMHGEDSDFVEIRGISVADEDLHLHDLQLPPTAHAEGMLVGGIPMTPLAALTDEALAHWSTLPGHADVLARWRAASAHARDLGEAMNALWLSLFGEQGLVVVDPRLPAFRAAAREVIDRYLADPDALSTAARRAGERLQAIAGRHPLSDATLDSFVFEISDGQRRKLAAAQAKALGSQVTLSPGVALRPAVQDGVFPTVVMACGPGELAYLLQLREVFEGVGVRAAAAAPRFSATWLPPAAIELIEAAGCEPWEVVAHADAVIARVAAARLPRDVAAALAQARSAVLEGLGRFGELARSVDASLPQMVESARGKVDFQFARLEEGLLAKLRGRLDHEHPRWRRLRYALLPGDKLQERRLALLEPLARRGAGVVGDLCELAAEHTTRAAAGEHSHHLLEA